MGLFDGLFRRQKKVPDNSAALRKTEDGPIVLKVGNVQGVGRREGQEDSFAILGASDPAEQKRRGLFAVVCDGMGGMANGKAASEGAVNTFCQLFHSLLEEGDIPQQLREGVMAVSDGLYQHFAGQSGTTAVAVRVFQDVLHWTSVGDSAVFLMRSGGVFQLNREHTYLNTLYERELSEEIICRERAETDEDARRLSAFVGFRDLKTVDGSLRPLPLQKGDVILLCSDGISGVLTPPELMEAMRLEPEEGCALLETLVLEKNVPEQDNYTGILIACK